MNRTAIEKTNAIPLRIAPFSLTSHVVSWLTPDFGKLTTLVKGACRPRSLFLGQYDLFYTCELLFYARTRESLHIARECAPIKTRSALRRNWRSSAAASYLCDLVARTAPEAKSDRSLFEAVENTLDFLCLHEAKLQVIVWFELMLAGQMGLAPRLEKCSACERPVDNAEDGSRPRGGAPPVFSHAAGGIICPTCAQNAKYPPAQRRVGDRRLPDEDAPVAPDILAILRTWQSATSAKAAQNTICSPRQLDALAGILGSFIRYHVGGVPPSRDIALRMTSRAR